MITLAPKFGREFFIFRRQTADAGQRSYVGRPGSIFHQYSEDVKMPEQNERYEDTQLYRIRHSAAHVMAQAVLEFYPETKYSIGPPIENGFYYDFDLPQPITQDDLEKIEKRMRQIVAGQ